jgi:hypothetical protein
MDAAFGAVLAMAQLPFSGQSEISHFSSPIQVGARLSSKREKASVVSSVTVIPAEKNC